MLEGEGGLLHVVCEASFGMGGSLSQAAPLINTSATRKSCLEHCPVLLSGALVAASSAVLNSRVKAETLLMK